MSAKPAMTSEARRDSFSLLIAYYNNVRSEILQRQMIRESTLTLFLGASATLAGFALTGKDDRIWLLYLVPLLGLGASSVYLQHTTATRALWLYLVTDFQDEVGRVTAPEPPPIQWDMSKARSGLAAAAAMRAMASGTLIVIPGLAAAILGLLFTPAGPGSIVIFSIAILAALGAGLMVIYGYARRPSWYGVPHRNTGPKRTP